MSFQASDELIGPLSRAHHSPAHLDHIEYASDASLIEGMDVDPATNEIGGNLGLEIRECKDKVGLQGEDLIDVGRREGAHAWLLAASLRRAAGGTAGAGQPGSGCTR